MLILNILGFIISLYMVISGLISIGVSIIYYTKKIFTSVQLMVACMFSMLIILSCVINLIFIQNIIAYVISAIISFLTIAFHRFSNKKPDGDDIVVYGLLIFTLLIYVIKIGLLVI